MTRWAALLAALSLGACHQIDSAPVSPLHADVRDYAMAACFNALPDRFLHNQGARWAGAIVQRGHGPVEKWLPIANAVSTELKRSGIAQGQGDGSNAGTVPLPVMTCGQITTVPAVDRALNEAEHGLMSDYQIGR